MSGIFSLAPGFGSMRIGEKDKNHFNGFSNADKPLKRLLALIRHNTRLKPGANETRNFVTHIHKLRWIFKRKMIV